MNNKDFDGINRFKWLIVLLIGLVFFFNLIGAVYYYSFYRNFFINFQKIYMIRMAYLAVMSIIATLKAWNILRRVESNQKAIINRPRRELYHAIVIPIYQESVELLRQTLKVLANHMRAKEQYLIFLAMQQRSTEPEKRAQELQRQFFGKFKLIHHSIHPLTEGEAAGKHSNQNYCLVNMEAVFGQFGIDPADVLFTTLDADNWMHEIYFEEVEIYLSKHDWNLDNYMFAPQQMFTRNNMDVPMLCRGADYIMGSVIFGWANNLSQNQNAASNYSISFNRIKKHGFFDTNADGMCDDYHNSMRMIWKSQGEVRIIPIFVMANFVSLQTGRGYLADLYARFWQAQRHMRMFLDAAYNFNMLTKNPFRWRTFWTTLTYFQNHFIALGLYLTGFMYIISKLIMGKSFDDDDMFVINVEAVIFTTVMFNYFIISSKSSQVLYKQKGESWWRFIEIAILGKVFLLIMAIIPELLATVRIALKPITYEAADKNIKNNSKSQ